MSSISESGRFKWSEVFIRKLIIRAGGITRGGTSLSEPNTGTGPHGNNSDNEIMNR